MLLNYDDPQAVLTVAVDGKPSDLRVTHSSMSLSSPDVFCAADTCPFTLNYLTVAFQDFTQPLIIGGDNALVRGTDAVGGDPRSHRGHQDRPADRDSRRARRPR